MEMNKKMYEQPTTEVVEIATTQILCVSGQDETGDEGNIGD